jgi:hypothetical protein
MTKEQTTPEPVEAVEPEQEQEQEQESEQSFTTFVVEGMRVLAPAAGREDEIAFVVKGTSFSRENGDSLSIKSRAVTIDEILAGGTIDLLAGTLTVPAGKRGRKVSPGLDADAIAARLAELTA